MLKIDKKYYPQVYLEQCKYKINKSEIKSLIDYDLDSDYESDEQSCSFKFGCKQLIQKLESFLLLFRSESRFFTKV